MIKKISILIAIVGLFLSTSTNINAKSTYDSIGNGLGLEEYNIFKNNDEFTMPKSKASIDVNEYIKNNNIEPAKISKQYNKLSKVELQYRYMLYNTTNLRPKGVIVHATAGGVNDNIDNEITYMSRNWRNAFVHSFADYKEIIETHNPEYAAWGAGPKANPYYIHIELVETGNTDRFIKSVNNQAYYVASKLKDFNLKPSRANKDKSGSVWFHSEVTKYLGGTDHSDPTGYFKKHNYSLAEFYELVKYHYDKLDSKWTSTKKVTYHSNGKTKNIYVTKKYNNKVVETESTTYDTSGRKIGYVIDIKTLSGIKKSKKTYTYKYTKAKKMYISFKSFQNYDYKGKFVNTTQSTYSSSSKLTRKKIYTYHSNNKIKVRKTYDYSGKYIKRYSNEAWYSTGKKYKALKYNYNRVGQLKSNKYGKSSRYDYKYKNGKLTKRIIRYYASSGKLNKKTYNKYY